MCNGKSLQAWQAECLRKLLALENVEPALLIIDESVSRRRGGLLKNLRKLRNLPRLFWYLHSALDRIVSRATRAVAMDERLAAIPTMRCRVRREGKHSEYFSEQDIAEARTHRLDFILRFGFNIIRGEILNVPRYGVWSFHHDDEEKFRGSPPGFWEIYYGDSVSGAILQRLTNSLDAGVVLKKGYSKTIKTSYTANRDSVFFDSTDWPAQVCIDIQNGVGGYLDAPPSTTSAPIFHAPTNVQMLAFLLILARNTLADVWTKLCIADTWNVGIVNKPIASFLERGARMDARWLPAPARSRFYADPFAVRDKDQLIIFLEDYDYYASRGRVSFFRFGGEDTAAVRPVLDKTLHISHPYLVKHEGIVYCIPETCDAKKVVLYQVIDFPRKWTEVTTLIDGFAGVDNTVFEYDGRWWLFATDQNDGPNHKLRIWFAPNLRGPWKPHARNPAKTDIRSSRPAGTPFVHGGSLFRPAQDCSETYGGRITLNRVLKLTPEEFEEEFFGTVDPDKEGPYPDGLHTISGVLDMTVIDGKKRTFIAGNPAMLIHKLRRILTGTGH